MILDVRRPSAVTRERVGNREEQASSDDDSAVAKELETKRPGFGQGAEPRAGEADPSEPDERANPQYRGRPARYIQKRKDADAPDGAAPIRSAP